jgi:PEP-CTERM motif
MPRVLCLLFCCLPMFSTAQASAIFYSFSYTSNDLLHHADANLVTTDNGNGTYTATSGAGLYDGMLITLIANPNAPGTAYSPSGYFYYDDLIVPGQNPVITNPGLLFAINGNGATELNIFSEGATYLAYLNTGFNTPWSFDVAATPEPATLPLALAGLVLLGLGRIRSGRLRGRGQPVQAGGPVHKPGPSSPAVRM